MNCSVWFSTVINNTFSSKLGSLAYNIYSCSSWSIQDIDIRTNSFQLRIFLNQSFKMAEGGRKLYISYITRILLLNAPMGVLKRKRNSKDSSEEAVGKIRPLATQSLWKSRYYRKKSYFRCVRIFCTAVYCLWVER